MRPSYVLDPSAIVALFDAHGPLLRMLAQAEAGYIKLILPAVAIAEANRKLQADRPAWEPILLSGGLEAFPLSENAAIEIGSRAGDLATNQVLHEVRTLDGVAVTREPQIYELGSVAVLVV